MADTNMKTSFKQTQMKFYRKPASRLQAAVC